MVIGWGVQGQVRNSLGSNGGGCNAMLVSGHFINNYQEQHLLPKTGTCNGK